MMPAIVWSLRVAASSALAFAFWISIRPAAGSGNETGMSDQDEIAMEFVTKALDVDSLVDVIAGSALFRADRSLPVAVYGAAPDQLPPAAPLPVLVLHGLLLGGAHPAAIIEGIPGSPGQVLVQTGDRPGDGSLQVQSIGRTGVVMVGRDTLWHLVLKGTSR